MKKEIKVGIIIVVSLAALIWGVNFLKGKNFFSKSKSYIVIYDDVSGLLKSNGVYIKGYKVGNVDNIDFSDKSLRQLRVILAIKSEVNIPVGTRARIYNLDLIGNKAVELIFSNSNQFYKENDTIPGEVEVTLAKMIEPYKDQVYKILVSVDSLSSSLIKALNPNALEHLHNTIENIDKISASINEGSDEMMSTFKYTRDFAKNLNDNNREIDELISNLNELSRNLKEIKYAESFQKLDQTIEETRQLMVSVKNGQGTMGQLITNDSLYVNLNKATLHLDTLVTDLKNNPKRYVHFSVFGKKNSK